jgi:hypothetical protein
MATWHLPDVNLRLHPKSLLDIRGILSLRSSRHQKPIAILLLYTYCGSWLGLGKSIIYIYFWESNTMKLEIHTHFSIQELNASNDLRWHVECAAWPALQIWTLKKKITGTVAETKHQGQTTRIHPIATASRIIPSCHTLPSTLPSPCSFSQIT